MLLLNRKPQIPVWIASIAVEGGGGSSSSSSSVGSQLCLTLLRRDSEQVVEMTVRPGGSTMAQLHGMADVEPLVLEVEEAKGRGCWVAKEAARGEGAVSSASSASASASSSSSVRWAFKEGSSAAALDYLQRATAASRGWVCRRNRVMALRWGLLGCPTDFTGAASGLQAGLKYQKLASLVVECHMLRLLQREAGRRAAAAAAGAEEEGGRGGSSASQSSSVQVLSEGSSGGGGGGAAEAVLAEAQAARLAWHERIGTPTPQQWYLRGWCEADSDKGACGKYASILDALKQGVRRERQVEAAAEAEAEAAAAAAAAAAAGSPAKGKGGKKGGGAQQQQQGMGKFLVGSKPPASAAAAAAAYSSAAPPGLWVSTESLGGLIGFLRQLQCDTVVELPPEPVGGEEGSVGGGGGEGSGVEVVEGGGEEQGAGGGRRAAAGGRKRAREDSSSSSSSGGGGGGGGAAAAASSASAPTSPGRPVSVRGSAPTSPGGQQGSGRGGGRGRGTHALTPSSQHSLTQPSGK